MHVNKKRNEEWNITTGVHDSAEAYEIVGIFLMWSLRYLTDISNTVIRQ